MEAESNVLNGMADHLAGGNVVTNDLAFSAVLCNYKVREAAGLQVRIVRNRDWRIDMDAMAAAIDADTRLVSVALVSNVNGFLTDVAALGELAHARGAYLYADIMQAAGAVPIDVGAMGIDLAACSTFKWLMGVKGFGFLYVRRDLQNTVVKASQPSGSVRLNYPPWTDADDGRPEISVMTREDATAWEVSYPSYEGVICAQLHPQTTAVRYRSSTGRWRGLGQHPRPRARPHRPPAGGAARQGLESGVGSST